MASIENVVGHSFVQLKLQNVIKTNPTFKSIYYLESYHIEIARAKSSQFKLRLLANSSTPPFVHLAFQYYLIYGHSCSFECFRLLCLPLKLVSSVYPSWLAPASCVVQETPSQSQFLGKGCPVVQSYSVEENMLQSASYSPFCVPRRMFP